MCSQGQWQKLSKGSWSRKMSPFDHKLVDVRMAGSSLEALKLAIEEEFYAYRTVFLVLGTVLIIRAPTFNPVKNYPPLSESEAFYSTHDNTPERRKFSDDEWKSFTKDCTKKGLEELVSSPKFGRWAVAHAERITLAPVESQQTSRWRGWLSLFR